MDVSQQLLCFFLLGTATVVVKARAVVDPTHGAADTVARYRRRLRERGRSYHRRKKLPRASTPPREDLHGYRHDDDDDGAANEGDRV